jgi:hypothetical protein
MSAPSPSRRGRASERLLAWLFLGAIAAVPVAQAVIELGRGQRVQFTDVLRRPFTAANLRQYESTLESQSWFQQTLRPQMQRLLFDIVRDTGAKAIEGIDGWFFYRPDVRYLVEPDRVEVAATEARWVASTPAPTRRASVCGAVVRFREQLRERGIELLVAPIPGKPSVYPDRLTRRAGAAPKDVRSPTEDLIRALEAQGVATVDLFGTFRRYRDEHPLDGDGNALYLARDTHWTPRGAQLAAGETARRLRALGWMGADTGGAAGPVRLRTQSVVVARHGDVLDMMQIPGVARRYPAERVECVQVLDPALGMLVPSSSDRPGTYRYPARPAPVLVLGDSFCRIYQHAEPQSLGEQSEPAPPAAQTAHTAHTAPDAAAQAAGANAPDTNGTPLSASPDASAAARSGGKRLLPGSAGFIAHLGLELGTPADAIVSDGGASTDVRRKLSTHPEILEGKRVVVWAFVERDVALGRAGWEDVPLPPKLD